MLSARGVSSKQAQQQVRLWQLSAQYQQLHAVAALVAAPALLPQAAFLAGTVLFCGSLQAYLLTGRPVFQRLTPIGSALLLGGWVSLAAHHAGLLQPHGALGGGADTRADAAAGEAPMPAAAGTAMAHA
jgi:uncharacterized membrane protein YgdD (TMEM256/DUF423 family)